MTRETKVGLVVSCSFLCLVGAVITLKMRQSPPAEEKVAQARQPEQQSAPPASVASIPAASEKEHGHHPAAVLPSALTQPENLSLPPTDGGGVKRAGATDPAGSDPAPPNLNPEPAPPPPPGANLPPPGGSPASLPSSPDLTPPPLPPGGTGPETKPELSDATKKEKPGENPLAKEERGDAKHGHREKGENEEKAKVGEGTKEKRTGAEPPLPPGAPPGVVLPPPGEVSPPPGAGVSPSPSVAGGMTPPPPGGSTPAPGMEPVPAPLAPAGEASTGGHGHGKLNGKHEHEESKDPAGSPVAPGMAPPPPVGSAGKATDPPPVPTPGVPQSVEPPGAFAPPPQPVGGGTPLPPIGSSSPADAPVVGKPQSLAPEPPAIPAPPPAGSTLPAPRADGAMPKVSSPGTDPAPPVAPGTPGSNNRPRVVLEPIQPMSEDPAPVPGEPRPAGVPTTLTPATVPVSIPMRTPGPIPAPAPQPPVGAPVTQVAPPIPLPESLPARPLAPAPEATTRQVVSYEEVRYSVRPGDTFESLSMDYYKDEGYAKALQQWNQAHPRVSEATRDGKLVPGDKIFIPPAEQLKQHYASAITPAKPPPPRPSGAIQTGFTTQAAPDFPRYKVMQNESIEVIARQTLGSSDGVNTLIRLNPNLRPGQTLQAGTLLLLPTGAQVPAENIPRP